MTNGTQLKFVLERDPCIVLKKDFLHKKRRGGKLDFRWQGPYVITSSLGRGLFQLNQLHGDKVITIELACLKCN